MTQAHQLTPEQREAIEWITREALDFAWERDLAPKDTLAEARSLLLAAELASNEELVASATELAAKAQARLDALPKPPAVALTLSVNGNDEGYELASLDEAATKAAEYIRGIPLTEIGVDFRVYVELLHEEGVAPEPTEDGRWGIIDTNPSPILTPGAMAEGIARFPTLRQAEDFLATSASIDPDKLAAGDYHIDEMDG